MRSSNDVALRKVIEEKTKVEGEIITLRTEIRLLRNEKENQEEEVVYILMLLLCARSKYLFKNMSLTISAMSIFVPTDSFGILEG